VVQGRDKQLARVRKGAHGVGWETPPVFGSRTMGWDDTDPSET
jgi:hypothetical protein